MSFYIERASDRSSAQGACGIRRLKLELLPWEAKYSLASTTSPRQEQWDEHSSPAASYNGIIYDLGRAVLWASMKKMPQLENAAQQDEVLAVTCLLLCEFYFRVFFI